MQSGKGGRDRVRGELRDFAAFGVGSAWNLGLKVGLNALLLHVLDPQVSYLVTHVIVFLSSYTYHAKISFRVSMSWHGMRDYLFATAAFKALDYGLFTILIQSAAVHAQIAVVFATMATTIVRFLTVRKLMRRAVNKSCDDSASGL